MPLWRRSCRRRLTPGGCGSGSGVTITAGDDPGGPPDGGGSFVDGQGSGEQGSGAGEQPGGTVAAITIPIYHNLDSSAILC